MPKLNAVDAISPAFKLTKLNLFSPFRWSFWWRIALLGFLTGELSTGGGGFNFNMPSNWPPTHKSGGELSFLARPFPTVDPHVLWVIIPMAIVLFLVLMFVFMYVGSVCRFILLEAVLNGQVSIRDAWSRWKSQGTRFFGFQIVFQLIFFVVIGVTALMFILTIGLSAFKSGGAPDAKIGAIIAAFFLFFIILFLLMVPYLIVWVLAKDFAVPVMALEGATFGQAWRKVWRMVKDETGSILGYFGMKIVLTIGAGVIFGIVIFIGLFIILLPVGGLGLAAVLAGKAAGLTWNVMTVTLAVCVGLVILALLMCVFSLICAPVGVFFPSYALYFFAGRYQPLHDRLFPPPPPAPPVIEPPPVPEPPVPPDIPPEPAAT